MEFDDYSILVDNSSNEIVEYLNLRSTSHLSMISKVLGKIPGEKSFRLILNSIESGIEICTPQFFEVLERSFDYCNIRPDLINDLTTTEVLDSTNIWK